MKVVLGYTCLFELMTSIKLSNTTKILSFFGFHSPFTLDPLFTLQPFWTFDTDQDCQLEILTISNLKPEYMQNPVTYLCQKTWTVSQKCRWEHTWITFAHHPSEHLFYVNLPALSLHTLNSLYPPSCLTFAYQSSLLQLS